MRKSTQSFMTAIVLCFALFLLIGCGRVNQENFDRLKTGMKYDEVVDILGSPDDCSQIMGVKSCTWGDTKRNIQAGFMGGTAVVFSATGLK